MVEKYIKELLFENDCVVVPGFGGFIAHHTGADIHPVTNKFLPPSKKIAFNEQLKVNDGLLISAVAAGEGISRSEALNRVGQFVHFIEKGLEKYHHFIIDDVGRVYLNMEKNIGFDPDINVNYLEDSFGLSELYFKPISKMDNFTPQSENPISTHRPPVKKEEIAESKAAKSSGKVLLLILPILIIFGLGLTFLFMQKSDNLLSGFFGETAKVESVVDETLVAEEQEVEEVEEEVTYPAVEEKVPTEDLKFSDEDAVSNVPPAAASTFSTGKYHVVVGAFGNHENALKLQRKLISKGVTVNLIEPGTSNRLYKVTVASFDTVDDAVAKIDSYKSDFGKDVWVYKY